MAYAPPSNVSGSVGMFQWINSVTNNWVFPGIILSTFLIMFVKQLTTQGNTVSKCFASSAFIAMILSVFGRLLGLNNTAFMTIFIILTAGGAIWMHVENN